MYLIGTDEAGYGPTLGPLVITGNGWECDADGDHGDPDTFYRLMSPVVSPAAIRGGGKGSRTTCSRDASLHIADSKLVFRGKSMEPLERAVLSLVSCIHGSVPTDLRALCQWLAYNQQHREAIEQSFANLFWLKNEPVTLPIESSAEEIELAGNAFSKHCADVGVRVERIACQFVMPRQFNDFVGPTFNKADLLSRSTLEIVNELLEDRTGHVQIDCDKHGGRSMYGPLLREMCGGSGRGDGREDEPEVLGESRQQSRYRFICDQAGSREFRFLAKGERFLHVALSSMVSKYVRELFMIAFNRYWTRRIKGLRPTKGYPQDAIRFEKDIESYRRSNNISPEDYRRAR